MPIENRGNCVITGCKGKAVFGLTSRAPLHCFNHRQEDEIRIKINFCRFEYCLERAKYGLRGSSATRCFKHQDKIIDIRQLRQRGRRQGRCQYPFCLDEKVKGSWSKFCGKHALVPLPGSYVKLVEEHGRSINESLFYRGQAYVRKISGIQDTYLDEQMEPAEINEFISEESEVETIEEEGQILSVNANELGPLGSMMKVTIKDKVNLRNSILAKFSLKDEISINPNHLVICSQIYPKATM